jgi:hypothetical protein
MQIVHRAEQHNLLAERVRLSAHGIAARDRCPVRGARFETIENRIAGDRCGKAGSRVTSTSRPLVASPPISAPAAVSTVACAPLRRCQARTASPSPETSDGAAAEA